MREFEEESTEVTKETMILLDFVIKNEIIGFSWYIICLDILQDSIKF